MTKTIKVYYFHELGHCQQEHIISKNTGIAVQSPEYADPFIKGLQIKLANIGLCHNSCVSIDWDIFNKDAEIVITKDEICINTLTRYIDEYWKIDIGKYIRAMFFDMNITISKKTEIEANDLSSFDMMCRKRSNLAAIVDKFTVCCNMIMTELSIEFIHAVTAEYMRLTNRDYVKQLLIRDETTLYTEHGRDVGETAHYEAIV